MSSLSSPTCVGRSEDNPSPMKDGRSKKACAGRHSQASLRQARTARHSDWPAAGRHARVGLRRGRRRCRRDRDSGSTTARHLARQCLSRLCPSRQRPPTNQIGLRRERRLCRRDRGSNSTTAGRLTRQRPSRLCPSRLRPPTDQIGLRRERRRCRRARNSDSTTLGPSRPTTSISTMSVPTASFRQRLSRRGATRAQRGWRRRKACRSYRS
jgi:hypothetical protein